MRYRHILCFLISVILVFSLCSCSVEENQDTIRVACIGDSITYGTRVTDWEQNHYPAVLGRLLGDDYEVKNYGVSGACVQSGSDYPYSITDAYARSLRFSADIVVIMLGTNDSKAGNWVDEDTFRQELTLFVDGYLSQSPAPEIYLCTPCKAYSDIYQINETQVAKIAEIILQVAQERSLPVIDIHAMSEAHPEYFHLDGVHPDNEGTAAIAEQIYKAITK